MMFGGAAPLPTEAVAVFDEPQVAEAVRSAVLLSEYIPVTANCSAVLFAMVGLAVTNGMDAPTRSGINVPKWKRYFNHLNREGRPS